MSLLNPMQMSHLHFHIFHHFYVWCVCLSYSLLILFYSQNALIQLKFDYMSSYFRFFFRIMCLKQCKLNVFFMYKIVMMMNVCVCVFSCYFCIFVSLCINHQKTKKTKKKKQNYKLECWFANWFSHFCLGKEKNVFTIAGFIVHFDFFYRLSRIINISIAVANWN